MISQLEESPSYLDIDVSELQKLGFTQSEISTAFSWLVGRVDESRKKELSDPELSTSKSFRMLHEGELSLFTKEAWGRIVNLNSLGLISNSDIERIIEKAIVGGNYKMSVDRIDGFLTDILAEGWERSDTTYRTGLTGNDTVH